MRYVVLLRYGFRDLRAVLKVERTADGTISCWSSMAPHQRMTWWLDGRYLESSDTGVERQSHRCPLPDIREPQVAYSIPGERLLGDGLPPYDWDLGHGATVQISGHAVLDEPHSVALQVVLVPRGEEPYHRETVGDRRIDEGVPDLWVVLDRVEEPPLRIAAVQRVVPSSPPLHAQAKPPIDPFDT